MKTLPLRLAVLDVGQGDTIVVTCPSTGEAIVVDCVDEHGVLDYLKSQQVKIVRGLILTHLHSDHYRRAVGFLNNCRRQLGCDCERVIVNPLPPKLPTPDKDSDAFPQEFGLLVKWMRENRDAVEYVRPSRHLPLDGAITKQLDFLFPYPADYPDALQRGYNNTSIVLRVRGTGSSALLTGDIESSGWELIPRRKTAAKADVLKFPHHGAWKKRDGTPADPNSILSEVGAKLVVFSVGSAQRGYNHPDTHVFDAFRDAGATILCTQATKHCGLATPDAAREQTEPLLSSHLMSITAAPVLCTKGTPCAGTVIIDLEHKPIVRSPNPAIHNRQIVNGVFKAGHKC